MCRRCLRFSFFFAPAGPFFYDELTHCLARLRRAVNSGILRSVQNGELLDNAFSHYQPEGIICFRCTRCEREFQLGIGERGCRFR